MYFLVCILLVPAWLVNDGFKDNFGRARPAKTTILGGELKFTRAFEISTQCNKNCSFVSGDVAGMFTFIAIALLAPRRRHSLYVTLVIGLGGAVGLIRIAEGRHFLSDVLVAGLVTTTCCYALHYIFYQSSVFRKIERFSKSRSTPNVATPLSALIHSQALQQSPRLKSSDKGLNSFFHK